MPRLFVYIFGAVAIVLASTVMADGKAVYEAKCQACHVVGVANAPKFGDKAAWEPRKKLGVDVLMKSVINGKNAMPPRAGQNVSDADIKESIEYMLSKVQ